MTTHLPYTKLDSGLAVWKDKNDIIHWAVGDRMVPQDRGTFILWTDCGKHDVPANSAWYYTGETITCEECKYGQV